MGVEQWWMGGLYFSGGIWGKGKRDGEGCSFGKERRKDLKSSIVPGLLLYIQNAANTQTPTMPGGGSSVWKQGRSDILDGGAMGAGERV